MGGVVVGFWGGLFGGVGNCFYLCTRKRSGVFSFFRLRMRRTRCFGDFSPRFCGKGNFLYLCKTNAKKLALIEEVIDIMNKGIAPFH